MYCDGPTWLPSRETKAAAAARLGIPLRQSGTSKTLRVSRATREHIRRKADGGSNSSGNIRMACGFCNSARWESPPDVHRVDMQVIVAAGLHPTNRPGAILDHAAHIKKGNRAIRLLRQGITPDKIRYPGGAK